MEKKHQEYLKLLRNIYYVSLLEGCTLLLLICVAVPLKHFFGNASLVHILGPAHGFAFLLYFWMLQQLMSAGNFSRANAIKMTIAAFIPFRAFSNVRNVIKHERSTPQSI